MKNFQCHPIGRQLSILQGGHHSISCGYVVKYLKTNRASSQLPSFTTIWSLEKRSQRHLHQNRLYIPVRHHFLKTCRTFYLEQQQASNKDISVQHGFQEYRNVDTGWRFQPEWRSYIFVNINFEALFQCIASIFRTDGTVCVLGYLMRRDGAWLAATYRTTCCIALDRAVRQVGLVHCCDDGCYVDFAYVTVSNYKTLLRGGRYTVLDRKQSYTLQTG